MQVKLTFRTQVNANRTYFYPVDDVAKATLKLMSRKALVPGDRSILEEFFSALGHTIDLEILPPEAPTF